MKLNKRKLEILKAIIDDYISFAEPVGSRTLAKKYSLGISSATIRNEMSDLEDLGLLVQPHTSAGRIPSNKAYRIYVDDLMTVKGLTALEAGTAKKLYSQRTNKIEGIIKQVAKTISETTNYTSIVTGPNLEIVIIKNIQLVRISERKALVVIVTNTNIIKDIIIDLPSDITPEFLMIINKMVNELYMNRSINEVSDEDVKRISINMQRNREFFNRLVDSINMELHDKQNNTLFLGGTSNIFQYPEYQNIVKAQGFLKLIEKKDMLYNILAKNGDEEGVKVVIGDENADENLKQFSMVTASYSIGDKLMGKVGVIGPTRMKYSKTIPTIRNVSHELTNILTDMFDENL